MNVLWCHSHLVWLVFESSIPTCACFHSETFLWLYTRQRLCTCVFLVRITHDVCINYAISMKTGGPFKSPVFLFLMSEALHIQCLWCPVYLWQHCENELNLRVTNNLACMELFCKAPTTARTYLIIVSQNGHFEDAITTHHSPLGQCLI